MDMSTPTNCYFGPLYVPLSPLVFVVSLLFLIPCMVGLLRTDPPSLRARRAYLRSFLIFFIAPLIALMAMALHWYATVDYVSAMAYLVQGPSDPLLRVFRAELLWFIVRPALTFALLVASLHVYQTRTRGTTLAVPHGMA